MLKEIIKESKDGNDIRIESMKILNKEYRKKFKFSKFPLKIEDDGYPIYFSIESFQIEGIPSISVYLSGRNSDKLEISFSSTKQENKKQIKLFQDILGEIYKNLDIIEEYLLKVREIDDIYYKG